MCRFQFHSLSVNLTRGTCRTAIACDWKTCNLRKVLCSETPNSARVPYVQREAKLFFNQQQSQ